MAFDLNKIETLAIKNQYAKELEVNLIQLDVQYTRRSDR